jgi:hypothetical protein
MDKSASRMTATNRAFMNNRSSSQLYRAAKSLLCHVGKLLLFTTAAWAAQAQAANRLDPDRFTRTTSVTSNLVATIEILNATPTPSDMIIYGFKTAGTNDTQVYLPPPGQHFCRVAMFDDKGQPLSKTQLATKLDAVFLARTYVLRAREFREKYGWKQLSPCVASPQSEGGIAYNFFKPEQLFDIKKPGNYTLTLEFQVLKPAKSLMTVVTFPPIEVPIVKKHDLFRSNAGEKAVPSK